MYHQALPSSSSNRELEIRRKINQLKQEGRIQKQDPEDDDGDDDDSVYAAKIRQKLGANNSKLRSTADNDGATTNPQDGVTNNAVRNAQIGSLPNDIVTSQTTLQQQQQTVDRTANSETDSSDGEYDTDDDNNGDNDEDESLVELVARRMEEQRQLQAQQEQSRWKQEARQKLDEIAQAQRDEHHQTSGSTSSSSTDTVGTAKASSTPTTTMTPTSGIGGSWNSDATETATQDVYQPKSGSWGAFPRPRDISKAYGGGRRVGPGYSNENNAASSVERTRELLQNYRVKMGIDVASEKEYAADIEEALRVASYAMQRGVYSSAVTALETVTKHCSSNSKVGGKVFLELAMAYEAVGRSKEAIAVYRTLSKSRIEDIKINAKRLLFGIEAIKFMQENVVDDEFSRKHAKTTFIDTTGLGNIASKFDDVYETAYVDLDRGLYKQLTEAVVRTSREARQILLRATGPGEVSRLRIVQALRSLSRHFDDSLQIEIDKAKPVEEPVAVIDGKPILAPDDSDDISKLASMDDFVLMDTQQMLKNLAGEWRLQLIADKRGDGVKFFNSTLARQTMNTAQMTFSSTCPQGFLSVEQSGQISFNSKKRILRRKSVEVSGGGGVLIGLLGTSRGAIGAVRSEQQVMTVDMAMLVTRGVPSQRGGAANDLEKDYFAVWRRVEPSTFRSI